MYRRRGLGAVDVGGLLDQAAARYGISSSLVRAVAGAESGLNPGAVSSKGAQGVMQLMPATAAQYGVTDPFDPGQNIDAGAHLLSDLLRRYNGDVSLALAAYNAGPGNVSKYGGVPPFPETQNYVRKIMGWLGGGPVIDSLHASSETGSPESSAPVGSDDPFSTFGGASNLLVSEEGLTGAGWLGVGVAGLLLALWATS